MQHVGITKKDHRNRGFTRLNITSPDENRPSPKQPEFRQRVSNLTDSKFNKDEEKLLPKGLSYAPITNFSQRTLESLLVDTEVSLRSQPLENLVD
jgi:hypothetical protein